MSVHKKICINPNCNREFTPMRSNQVTCGQMECKQYLSKMLNRKRYGTSYPKAAKCSICGCDFTARNRRNHTCGSDECIATNRRMRKELNRNFTPAQWQWLKSHAPKPPRLVLQELVDKAMRDEA